MPHDVAQTDDTDKSARVWVILTADDHKAVNSANLDQREDGSERVLRVASDDALKVRRTLLQSLLDREVQRLVGSKADQGLMLACNKLRNSR